MERAEVVGPWAQDPDEGFNVPKVWLDYGPTGTGGLQRATDVTGQDSVNISPDPNLVSHQVIGDTGTIDAIEANGDYLVLWREPA